MSLTFGFYNSLNHDRKYNAADFSGIFDGVIRDGVFATYGDGLHVSEASGMNVQIGIGRAWFNHTWTYNDAILPIEGFEAELTLDRIDAVVLEVNRAINVRANSIKMVKGPIGATASKPSMQHDEVVDQYALAYIHVPAGATEIKDSMIENVIGTTETPFVTGVLETLDVGNLYSQWQGAFTEWNDLKKQEFDQFEKDSLDEFTEWSEQYYKDFDEWSTASKLAFNTWFSTVQYTLSGDAAGKLQNQIDGELVNTWTGGVSFKPLNDRFMDSTGVVVDENGKTLKQAIKDGSIGGGGRTMSQAEYEALPESEQNSGLFFITDGANEDGYDSAFVRHKDGTVYGALEGLNSNLTANGDSGTTQFYFDFKDGEYGWNSDVNRGADTFHPFRGGGNDTPQTYILTNNVLGNDNFKTNLAKFVLPTRGNDYNIRYKLKCATSHTGSSQYDTIRLYGKDGNIRYELSPNYDTSLDVTTKITAQENNEELYLRVASTYNSNVQSFSLSVNETYAYALEYLYKDGKQNVAWENNVTVSTSYTNDGPFTETDISYIVTTPSSNLHSKAIRTKKSIDLSGYSKLKILTDGNIVTSIDVSSYDTSAYLVLLAFCASSKYYLRLYVSSTSDIDTKVYTKGNILEASSTSATIVVNRVWLEK